MSGVTSINARADRRIPRAHHARGIDLVRVTGCGYPGGSRPKEGMPRRTGTRALTGALALAMSAGLLGAPVTAGAAPSGDVLTTPVTTHPGDGTPYPRQEPLPEPPVDDTDAALKPGLTAYHDVSRRLNAAMAGSDRVSAEVITQTGGGRDVVLVTLTAPETRARPGSRSGCATSSRTTPPGRPATGSSASATSSPSSSTPTSTATSSRAPTQPCGSWRTTRPARTPRSWISSSARASTSS